MTAAVTEGIKVSVQTEFQPEYSSPQNMHFVFAYKIMIENFSEHTVQLLRRKWMIYDSDGSIREVEGEGVVGQQPILEQGEIHQYVSGCNLKSSIGKMKGFYVMERIMDGKQFKVAIPEFVLIPPYKLN
ncbi:MAG: Co2+/Mg2+ efflux protein ApaG [Bacteroidota bacterium]|nr:Co2+/Mg2+ efflux protein ApaG [Bacteroidota bacterium]